MTAVLFASHNDDESLFACYQLLHYKPHVIVVLRSFLDAERGGATYQVRERETDCAMSLVGCTWEQWHNPDNEPNVALVERQMMKATRECIDLVIAPAREQGGHEHHNMVAAIAERLELPLLRYLTYKRGQGRSKGGTEVLATPEARDLKLQALACYESQIAWPDTAPWFPDGEYGDLREWVAR